MLLRDVMPLSCLPEAPTPHGSDEPLPESEPPTQKRPNLPDEEEAPQSERNVRYLSRQQRRGRE